MRPAFVVLHMYQGATFRDVVTLENDVEEPLALADTYDGARMQIREYADGPLVLELSTAGGSIALDNQGRITFNVTAATTAALSPQIGSTQWVYDLELYQDQAGVEIVDRALEGVVVFWPEVTRNVV